MQHLKYREDIDILRGLAVVLVVAYHAFPEYFSGGFVGVDVFFVISGYLITSIILSSLDKNDFSIKEFYSRRIRRLFPALIAVLLFSLAFGWLVLYPSEYRQLSEHALRATVFTLNFDFIKEVGYFDVSSHYKPLLHLWTLSVEEQYYLFWPILVYFFLRINKHLLYFFLALFLLSFVFNIYYTFYYAKMAYFHTFTRFWELTVGSLLALYVLSKKSSFSSFKLSLVGIVIILISSVLISSDSFPGWWAILPVLGASLVILGNSPNIKVWLLKQIGLISYPLYLWHWVLISFVWIYLGEKPNVIVMFFLIALSFGLAVITYKYIEVLRYKDSTFYLILGMVFIAIVSYFIVSTDGAKNRKHIQYINNAGIQFQRTPSKDGVCEAYTSALLGKHEDFDYCRADDVKAKKLVAIIGDSHAHVMFPGVVEQARKRGYGTVLFANSSCPPLKGFMWGRNSKEVELCQIKINEILGLLSSDKRISKVIFATRGPVYIHGEVNGKFTKESVRNSLNQVPNKKQTYYTYFAGFDNTMSVLEGLKHIKSVSYMLEDPELDFLPKEVIPRPYDYFGISVNKNYMKRDLYLERMSKYRYLMKAEAKKWSKLNLLDPINDMCDQAYCYVFKNKTSLYADDDHLSVYGSKYIVSKFADQIFNGK